MRGLAGLLCLLLLVAITAVYGAGARSADPGVENARYDLDLVQAWQRTGKLEDHPSHAHLTKPGYLAYLRLSAPAAGERRPRIAGSFT